MTSLLNPIDCQEPLTKAIRRGLQAFEVPVPQTLVEWADQNFYLSPESSDTEGKWKTLAFQRGIMNAMSNDDIREIWCQKGMRVGYTKMLMAYSQWAAEHKKRTGCIWQPNDGDRDHFVKTEIDTAIRDNPAIRSIFPAFEKKSKHNTLELKQFIGAALHLKGGKSGKNYRRMTLQWGAADEFDAFDDVIDDDGKPGDLIRGRVMLSAFSKVIFGSTPLVRGKSKIESGEQACDIRLRYHIDCPNCGTAQEVRWGGKDKTFGIKYPSEGTTEQRSSGAAMQCEDCQEEITDKQFRQQTWDTGIWMTEDKSVYLGNDDGVCYLADGTRIDPHPESVGFKAWQGVSELIPFSKLVSQWLAVQNSEDKDVRSFVNLVLAETYEVEGTEKADHELMHRNRPEHYDWEIPDQVNCLTLGIDQQDDRFELGWVGWGAGEESWNIKYQILQGDLAQPIVWDRLERTIRETQFRKRSGEIVRPTLTVPDHGGHYSRQMEALCRKIGAMYMMPAKGLSVYGRPIVDIPRKPNKNKVYLLNVGTDTVKNLVHQRLQIKPPSGWKRCQSLPGYIHWPVSEDFDEEYFKQFCAERRVPKWTAGGVKRYVWDAEKRRNEPWDVFLLNMVAVQVLQQRFGISLDEPVKHMQLPSYNTQNKSLSDLARELNDG